MNNQNSIKQPTAPTPVASGDLLATFGTEYPIMADLKGGWYLVAHPNGPAIACSRFDLLSSLAHQHEDVPETIRREAVWQLMRWAANQPTWPKVANIKAEPSAPVNDFK